MKIKDLIEGIDSKSKIEKLKILSNATMAVICDLEDAKPDLSSNEIETLLKERISKSGDFEWLTIGMIKERMNKPEWSNTRVGLALKKLNIISDRKHIKKLNNTRLAHWIAL